MGVGKIVANVTRKNYIGNIRPTRPCAQSPYRNTFDYLTEDKSLLNFKTHSSNFNACDTPLGYNVIWP